jgi:hypothetical protein
MSANGKNALTYTDGIAEAVNERGVKLGGTWHNFSRYATSLAPDSAGQHVKLGLDAQGFIRTVSVEGTSTPTVNGRDRTITRLAVLKAAAGFIGALSQSREDVKSEHVLKLADTWLRWVEAEPEPENKS